MIGGDLAEGTVLIAGFREVAGIDDLPAPKVQEFEFLARSASSPRFPGAILAWPRSDDVTLYYAVTKTTAEWRQLRPLLLAFAGPTLTDFSGQPQSLDSTVPVEKYLLEGGWHVVARLRPGDTEGTPTIAQRSLFRLVQTIETTTFESRAAPLPTSTLVSRFINSLNGNDRAEALRILEVLRSEMRVDALNLGFLEVHIHAHFCDWQSIREMNSFDSLRWTRRPPAVSSALLESLYQVHLAPIDDGASLEAVRACYLGEVCEYARPLVRLPAPANLRQGGWRIYALEAICAETRNLELELAVHERAELVGGELVNELQAVGRGGHQEGGHELRETSSSVVEAKQALAVAVEVDSLASIGAAIETMQRLSEEQRRELLSSEPFRTMWRTVQSETPGGVPGGNWREWLENAGEHEYGNALGIARRGLEEWSLEILEDSAEIEGLVEALSTFPDKAPQYDRLLDALPLLVAWVAKDPKFPRSGLSALYETLLVHLVTCSRHGTAILESATTIVRALLLVGVTARSYKNLLDDALALIGPGPGTRSVDCILEIVEETVACPSPEPVARTAFWYEVLARFEPIVAHLSAIQLFSLTRLGESLGWDIGNLRSLADSRGDRDNSKRAVFAECLRGRSIGIYSLTEAALRQAESLLKNLVPDIDVALSSERGGSRRLKSMASGADILVMVTASATHAATQFIQQHRPRTSPLLYAKGRGVTSILRALEDYVETLGATVSSPDG